MACLQIRCCRAPLLGPHTRHVALGRQRPQQFAPRTTHCRRGAFGLPPVSATSAAAGVKTGAEPTVNPILRPIKAWRQWWYIGATPQADLPKSQQFSRILARLWGFVKHSKTTLTFAVIFMVHMFCAAALALFSWRHMRAMHTHIQDCLPCLLQAVKLHMFLQHNLYCRGVPASPIACCRFWQLFRS